MDGTFISSTAQPFCKMVVIGIYGVKAFETGSRCFESESMSLVEERFPLALCQRDHNWQLHKRNEAFAALRPVYPGGRNVFAQAGTHVLPLTQGQRRAQHEGHFKVTVNCSLRPGKRAVDLVKSLLGKGGTTDFQVRQWGIRRTRKSVLPLNRQPASWTEGILAARYFRITHSVLSVMHSCSDNEKSDSLCFPNL